jgi:uncharacterized protein (TIGR00375 family)
MRYYADLHVHSRFSRATSADATLEQFAAWGRRKGLTVLGTGDFTHPAWRQEIRDKLEPAEPGLFRLRADVETALPAAALPVPFAEHPVRFILTVEISTIYKRGDRTRKVHHLVVAPDLDSAERFAQRLGRVGNLASDGRPILGLDSRDLLETTLEADEGCYVIPAHIWTPWFSVLGANSGFDAVEDCYRDLAPHVFAVETGLSSDPPMNWRVSGLDRYRLVSNSDAHSPARLGREACVFDTPLDYSALRRALETGAGYGGTVEFFPEEGKYHLDGHRKCGVCLTPDETRRHQGICPVCGKPLTIGVMNRVEELADRPEGGGAPRGATRFRSLIPLAEVLGELLEVGPDSRRVQDACTALVATVGPELHILEEAPVEAAEAAGPPGFGEALRRMRSGQVIRTGGYDGEYGVIRLFEPGELRSRPGVRLLIEVPPAPPAAGPARRAERVGISGVVPSKPLNAAPTAAPVRAVREPPLSEQGPGLYGPTELLDPEQRAAAHVTTGPLLIVAGPGTGKTRTLTHRIARLVAEVGVPPEHCLAITFTQRAAQEMRERLCGLLPAQADRIAVMTFHALGYRILREQAREAGLPESFRVASDEEAAHALREDLKLGEREARELLRQRSRTLREPAAADARLREAERALRRRNLVDFDDLVVLPVRVLDVHPDLAAAYRARFPWISVDEYQDIDAWQYRLLRHLVPPGGNLCVIGDPDQAIYGFRGTDVRLFQRFTEDFPGARVVNLKRNYRSGRAIVGASLQVIRPTSLVPDRALESLTADATPLVVHEAATDRAEAEFVVHTVEQLIGGASFFSMDSGRVAAGEAGGCSFADIAVLYRTDAQADGLVEALVRSGMPFQKRSHARLADNPAVRAVTAAMEEIADEADLVRRLERAVESISDSGQRAAARAVAPVLRGRAACATGPGQFLSDLAMAADVDLWDPRADAISLLTLHASKGLEFPVVFITGCEDGMLPLRWGSARAEDLAEERRLFFVGVTRAGRRLFLSHARRRLWRGAVRDMAPSPFLRDIADSLLERRQAPPRPARPDATQLTLF